MVYPDYFTDKVSKSNSFLLFLLHKTRLQNQPTRAIHLLRIIRQPDLINRPLLEGRLRPLDSQVLNQEYLISSLEDISVCVFGWCDVHSGFW